MCGNQHIQRMRLHLQSYDLTVKYRRGRDMELPDTLSRAQLSEKIPEINGLECISMLNFVSVSDQNCAELQQLTKEELSNLLQVTQSGWPENRRDVSIPVHPYWDSRSQLASSHGIIMRESMLIHQSHTPITHGTSKVQTASTRGPLPARNECANQRSGKRLQLMHRLSEQAAQRTSQTDKNT